MIKGIILCEGSSDQVLVGAYLKKTKGWPYPRPRKDYVLDD